jgi:hypothetical protein
MTGKEGRLGRSHQKRLSALPPEGVKKEIDVTQTQRRPAVGAQTTPGPNLGEDLRQEPGAKVLEENGEIVLDDASAGGHRRRRDDGDGLRLVGRTAADEGESADAGGGIGLSQLAGQFDAHGVLTVTVEMTRGIKSGNRGFQVAGTL